ncbi:MAG: isochorismatase family protein [Haloferacaceae archaeon]
MANRLDDAYVPDVVPDEDLEYFERGGHGERIGWGDSPALVLVDLTDEFASERSEAGQRAVDAAATVLEAAREVDAPVVFTRPDRGLPDGYRGTTKPKAESAPGRSGTNEIHEDLAPRDDEYVLDKPRASGFFDTHLSHMLHEEGVDTLIVGGISTSGCVRATVVDGHSSNFNVIVPFEATADRSEISHEVSLFDMDMKYADVTPTDEVVETLLDQSERATLPGQSD